MSNAATYEKAYAKYQETAARAKGGDKVAHADKAKALADCRAIKREAARSGVDLNVRKVSVAQRGDKTEVQVVVKATETDSRRSLQEEYCRRFSDKTPVKLGDQVTDLRTYHRKRLLGR